MKWWVISGNINEVSCTKTRQLNFFLILFLVDTMSHEVVLKNRVVVFIHFSLCFKSPHSFVGELGEDPPPDGYSASPTGGADGVLPEAAVYPAGWLSGSPCFGRINKTLSWLFSFNSSITEQCRRCCNHPKGAAFVVLCWIGEKWALWCRTWTNMKVIWIFCFYGLLFIH